MNIDFSPKLSLSPSDECEKASVNFVEKLLLGYDVKTLLSVNDKTPNYDGYIELLNSRSPCGKVTVQVKTNPKKYTGKRKFDIPTSLIGYAQSVPTEIVILMSVDYINKVIYWKHISKEFIAQIRLKVPQKTITYNFTQSEILSEGNIKETIDRWKRIYAKFAEAIIPYKNKIQNVIDSYACTFEHVNSHFFNLPDSYIERDELIEIYNWIYQDTEYKKDNINNVCILTGDAGIGKSVIIKQLANRLKEDATPILAIKADIKKITSNEIIDAINEIVNFISSDKNVKAVLLIDQIDALSQSLSNDRVQINAYLGIINKYSSLNYANLRIVVSCREFDLDYDPILNQLKTKKIFKLDKLKIDEVKATLKILMDEKSIASISNSTLQLLQIPQYLDTYCRIYQKNEIAVFNISTPYGLYEELWRIKILHPNSQEISPSILEELLFKIANKIQKDQTLTVSWRNSGKDINYINYLSTEGIITRERITVRFFHQSFYDYVFARKFLSDTDSLYSFILNSSQGLFIRSSVKQALEFLRDYDPDSCIRQTHLLLCDVKVRYHIKLLILQYLASIMPGKKDIELIVSIKSRNPDLFYDFIKLNTTIGWFDGLINEINAEIINIENIDNNTTSLLNFSVSFTSERIDETFEILDKIKNENVTLQIAPRVLWVSKNHKNPKVLKWYKKLYENSKEYARLNFLEKAIFDNPEFVCEEVGKMLQEAVVIWAKDEKYLVDDHILFDKILELLSKKHSLGIYAHLKNTVTNLIDRTSHSHFDYYLSSNTAFNGYSINNEPHDKLLTFLISILKQELRTHADFVIKEVSHFLSTKSNTLHRIALEIMLEVPSLFTDITYALFENPELIEYLLDNDQEGYYFKELLKVSYPYFTLEQKEWIQQYTLSYVSNKEKIANRDRRLFNRPLYFILGDRQRALIYSLPVESLTSELRHKKYELDRRSPYDYKNEKPSHNITMANICGGLVSDEIYEKFSLKNWETSFLKLEDPHWRKGKSIHLDIRIHIRKFRECVKDNPDKFYPFVINMFSDSRINIQYKSAGLQGLVEAQYRIDDLILFFELLCNDFNAEIAQYDIVEIAKLFIKQGSKYSDDISKILISIIKENYETIYKSEMENEPLKNEHLSELLTKGINTIHGWAIDAYIENAVFQDRRIQTYENLIALSETLSIEHKLTVLYRIYHLEVFDESLFDKLLVSYLQLGISEFVYVCGHIINKYLVNKPQLVIPYLHSVADLPHAQKGLGLLCYLGCCYGNKECEELLYAKINDQILEFSKGALNAAFENFSHPLCNSHSIFIINKLADSSVDSIIDLFSYKFSDLSCDDFKSVKSVLDKLLQKHFKDIKSIVDYLEKCCSVYPKDCFYYLDIMIKTDNYEEMGLNYKEYFELLFAIYKYLKHSTEIQDKIMDTFDYALKTSYNHYGIKELINDMDFKM